MTAYLISTGFLDVRGKVVMEIGCGCGLAGLAAAAHGASKVMFLDCDDRALAKLAAQVAFVDEEQEMDREDEAERTTRRAGGTNCCISAAPR